MSFKFEKLMIWQDSMTFGEEIFNMTKAFPVEERFNLTSQIRRAADSVALNISEGSVLQSKAKYRSYISEEIFDQLYAESYRLMNHIIAFRNKLL